MRVLLVGSDTPVGRDILELLLRRGRHVEPLASADCRWKSERQTKKTVVRADCEFVVDTRISAALESAATIHDVDLKRVQWLAKSCQKNAVGYVFLSTAAVFSGNLTRRYTEEDYPDSTEGAGELALSTESTIRDYCEQHLILRLGPVFSHLGENPMTRLLVRLIAGETLRLENHRRGGPVAAADAARVVSGMLDQFSTGAQNWGIYHYCSSDSTNCFEFGEALVASASQFHDLIDGAVELARPDNPLPPLNRSLNCSKLRNNFAIKQAPWRAVLAQTVKQYFEARTHVE